MKKYKYEQVIGNVTILKIGLSYNVNIQNQSIALLIDLQGRKINMLSYKYLVSNTILVRKDSSRFFKGIPLYFQVIK